MRRFSVLAGIDMGGIRRLLGRIALGIGLLCLVFVIGSAGYHYFEGWSWGQSTYTTLLIVSTLGFGDMSPETTGGKALTSGIIISGVGTLFYLLSTTAETLINASLGVSKVRAMERKIAQLREHHIICGYGRVGQTVAAELAAEHQQFVVIDLDEAVMERARRDGHAAIQGDATNDEVLRTAGIDRASGLLLATASDAANVFITLAARIANERLQIVARANDESSEAKLRKAGANHVIAPAHIGGRRMAGAVLRPGATEVVESLLHADDQEHWLEQLTVRQDSPLCGRPLAQVGIDEQTGARVIALRRADGELLTNPDGGEHIAEGDVLVIVGRREQFVQLAELAKKP